MSRTVAQAFAELRDRLKLDPNELAKAIAIHNAVTLFLKSKGLIVDAFLQGSLRRKTMVAPLRDIDKVVILKVDWRQITDGAQLAAEAVAGALRELYPDDIVEVGKHCVTLDFGDATFKFDIVPAIDLGDDVEIVNTKTRSWQWSNTRELIRVVQDRNKACSGNWVHQVRFAKLFVRENLSGVVPGLHVESWAFASVKESMSDDEALAKILSAGAAALQPHETYFDPTGVDELGKRLDTEERDQARIAFEKAAAQAREAVALRRSGDDNAAISLWHELLRSDFPKPSAHVALAGLGGGAGVTALGVVATTATVRPTPTRSWRP
jgi:hypothetical protein